MTCHSAAMARACSILTGTPHRPVPGASVALDYQVKLRPPGFVRHRRVERFAVFFPDNTHETSLPTDDFGARNSRLQQTGAPSIENAPHRAAHLLDTC